MECVVLSYCMCYGVCGTELPYVLWACRSGLAYGAMGCAVLVRGATHLLRCAWYRAFVPYYALPTVCLVLSSCTAYGVLGTELSYRATLFLRCALS
eukprot:3255491-Rhodomonas_salina.1